MPHTFDASQLPLVNATFSGDITSAIIDEYQSNLIGLFDHGVRFVMVLETFDIGDIERSVLSSHSSFYKKYAGPCALHWLGVGLVLKSTSTRFMLSTLLLMAPLPMPYKVVRTTGEGREFVAKRLIEAKMPLPPELRGYRSAPPRRELG